MLTLNCRAEVILHFILIFFKQMFVQVQIVGKLLNIHSILKPAVAAERSKTLSQIHIERMPYVPGSNFLTKYISNYFIQFQWIPVGGKAKNHSSESVLAKTTTLVLKSQ